MAARAGNVIEALVGKLRPGRHGPAERKPRVISHRSVGDRFALSVRGRVVRMGRSVYVNSTNGTKRSASAQLVSVYRAFDVVEVPFVTVQVSLNGATASGQTDAAGFFAVDLPAANNAGWSNGWHHPQVRVLANEPAVAARDLDAAGEVTGEVTGDVFVPPTATSLVIVSDLDDTAMDTQSVHQFEMVRKVLFSPADKRSPVDGVPDLYRQLQRGIDGQSDNPICFISSGAWNLYDHIVDYLDLHQLPKGAVYLSDWGSRRRSFRRVSPADKAMHVTKLLTRYSTTPFLLVGDDVIKDPELYADIATRFPQRITAIWIRIVLNDRKRLREIERLRESLQAVGTELVVAADSAVFASHARERAWIPE